MPWCEDCAKFWNPTSMRADGTCPTCGRVLPVAEGPGAAQAEVAGEGPGDVEGGSPSKPEKLDLKKLAGDNAKAPWHFKLLMVLLAVYLTWRLVQLIGLIF